MVRFINTSVNEWDFLLTLSRPRVHYRTLYIPTRIYLKKKKQNRKDPFLNGSRARAPVEIWHMAHILNRVACPLYTK